MVAFPLAQFAWLASAKVLAWKSDLARRCSLAAWRLALGLLVPMAGTQAVSVPLTSVPALSGPAVLRDPRSLIARQPLTSEQKADLQRILAEVQRRPAYRTVLRGAVPLTLDDVLLTFTAPFRRAEPERLDVVRSGKALLLIFNDGREGWSITPSLQMAQACTPTLAYTLRDINLDGLREVAAQLTCGDAILGQNVLLLLDFSGVYPRALGVLPLEEFSMEGQQQRHARIIEVFKGQPVRYQAQELLFTGVAQGQPLYTLTGNTFALRIQQSWPLVAHQLW